MEKPVGNIGNVEERLDELFEIYGKLSKRLCELIKLVDTMAIDIYNLQHRIARLERR